MRAYEVEVRFYAEIAPRVAMRQPRLLFAAIDPDEAWFTLLLEDLVGATQGDEIAGCDVEIGRRPRSTRWPGSTAPCWEARRPGRQPVGQPGHPGQRRLHRRPS